MLHIIQIEATKWECFRGHPYRKARKCIMRLIREKNIEGLLTTADIAEKLGDLKLPYLYTYRLVFRRGGIQRNQQRDWHLAVIDDGTPTIDVVLDLIYEDLNYLTVVTDRSEYFTDFAETVYEETGLLVQMSEKIPKYANILLYMKP